MTECIKIKCNGYAILIILFLPRSKIGLRLNYELFLKIFECREGRWCWWGVGKYDDDVNVDNDDDDDH